MIKEFFLPEINLKFCLRLATVALTVWFICSFVFVPAFVNGDSMKPTYNSREFNICNKLYYLKSGVSYGDIVILRYVGRTFFLKRVVGLAGDRVEFRDGKLFVNNECVDEPYVKYPCSWNMKPVVVREGMIFVVGDNRSMPIERHMFGMISVKRIAGAPLW